MNTSPNALSERTRLAMDRRVAFWRRQMSDQILVTFVRGGRRSNALDREAGDDEWISDGHPPLYEDVPKMLQDFEAGIGPAPAPEDVVHDDSTLIPEAVPELQFGHGFPAVAFGAKLEVAASETHTLTWCEPVVTDWDQVDHLVFDEQNEWIQRSLACLRYFVEHAHRRFAIRQMQTQEGANFIVAMRGTTQAFYDLADRPPRLRDLYELGYTSGSRLFELRRAVVKAHNERVFAHPPFSDLSDIHNVPWLDTDAYALCSPKVFAEIGFEFKQKILNRYGGGKLYIHGAGRHIVPFAGRLNNLTQLSLYDDPKCPTYFSQRHRMRETTFDIPLTMDCSLDELLDGLKERTLPGGVHYTCYAPAGISSGELNSIIGRVRQYRAGKLAARPKPAV